MILPKFAWILKLFALLFGAVEVKERGDSGDWPEGARNVVVGEKRANLAAIFLRSVLFFLVFAHLLSFTYMSPVLDMVMWSQWRQILSYGY